MICSHLDRGTQLGLQPRRQRRSDPGDVAGGTAGTHGRRAGTGLLRPTSTALPGNPAPSFCLSSLRLAVPQDMKDKAGRMAVFKVPFN